MYLRFSIVAILFILLCSDIIAEASDPVERDVYLMGTSFHVILHETNREKGNQELEMLIRSVEETENQLSTWRPESELSRLNRQPVNQPFQLSPSLCSLWEKLETWVSQSNGAFDPSVGNLAVAWGIHDIFRIPEENEISSALQNTGFRLINRTNCTLTKTRPVLIDAGAFGKGEAIDRAMRIAEQQKIEPLMIDFGGQLAVRGIPPGKEAWDTFLANPLHREESSSIRVTFKGGSLSTSGGSERDGKANGKRIGHHLDPRNGHPISFFGSVTVWHRQALDADILSTALYVKGPEEGYQWALAHDIAACFQVINGKSIETIQTPAFQALLKTPH
jgi:FAD:protein FMN transferase